LFPNLLNYFKDIKKAVQHSIYVYAREDKINFSNIQHLNSTKTAYLYVAHFTKDPQEKMKLMMMADSLSYCIHHYKLVSLSISDEQKQEICDKQNGIHSY
jgi:hypothetical protein